MSPQQHSAFFHLMHRLLCNCKDGMSLAENTAFLKKSLLDNCSEATQDEDGLVYDFTPKAMRIVLDFATTG